LKVKGFEVKSKNTYVSNPYCLYSFTKVQVSQVSGYVCCEILQGFDEKFWLSIVLKEGKVARKMLVQVGVCDYGSAG
jgi:hypothetical protein